VKTAASHRQATFGRGRAAEVLALLALGLKGYRPLAWRFSAAGGEIDLIVRRGRTIAFVEVKARGLMDTALVSITPAKRRRFSRAARAWLSRNPWAAPLTWRADAVFVAPGHWPQHLEAAFEIDGF
jgi:putative endonuclease